MCVLRCVFPFFKRRVCTRLLCALDSTPRVDKPRIGLFPATDGGKEKKSIKKTKKESQSISQIDRRRPFTANLLVQ